VWQPFWAVPLALATTSIALGLGLPMLDEAAWRGIPVLFQGGPDGARSLLGTIASAMISVTGLVFSITMVVLQLASSQFTPRVLGTFLDSRITQVTLGVFTGTFLYALTVLRSVRGASEGIEEFVPQLATSVAFAGVVASVGCFLAVIHHITTSIQVQEVLARTASATVRALDRMMPADQSETAARGEQPRWTPGAAQTASDVLLHGGADRCVTDISYRRLVDIAEKSDVVITLDRQVGDYLVEGERVAQIWRSAGAPHPETELEDGVRSCIALGRDRSLRQDVAFGVRQIVDVAERALSPGVNDPTTAAQAIDALHSVLRRAVQRRVPSRHATDGEGTVRLVYRPQTVEQLLDLGVTEIAHWGRSSVRVPDHLRRLLDDLDGVTLPCYRDTLAGLRSRVDAWEEERS
jgi:uncharacterized membrane protein